MSMPKTMSGLVACLPFLPCFCLSCFRRVADDFLLIVVPSVQERLTPLQMAITAGQPVQTVKALLKAGAKVDLGMRNVSEI